MVSRDPMMIRVTRRVEFTLLDVGLLSLARQELIQFLLVAITELGDIELGLIHDLLRANFLHRFKNEG